MNNEELKQLWKTQAAPVAVFSEQELQRKVKTLQRKVALRNWLESLVAVPVIAVFAYYIWAFRFPLMQIGSALVIGGALVVLQQLHRRATNRPLPETLAGLPCLDFHRAQLERQRDALRSVWLWYVGPFVPGMLVFRWGVETELGANAPFARGIVANLVIAGVMLAVIWLNHRAANKLQQQINKLDLETAELAAHQAEDHTM
jgi:hypothetical protein